MIAHSLVGWELADPLGPPMVSYLLSRHYETSEIDFKETIDLARGSDFAKTAKHIFAMANYGGGYIIVGFRERMTGGFDPIGLPEGFHLDQANLQGKFNGFSSDPITLGYVEVEKSFNDDVRRFAILFVQPPPRIIVPVKDGTYLDEKDRRCIAFKSGIVLIRRGTQSIVATADEKQAAERRLSDTNYHLSLVSGAPDPEPEQLFSDLFEIVKLPGAVYSGRLDDGLPESWQPDVSAYCLQGQEICTFDDLNTSTIRGSIQSASVETKEIQEFGQTPKGRRILTRLLGWELVGRATSLGLSHDDRRDRLYYPLPQGSDRRRVRWRGLARSAERTVATKRVYSTLHREVVLHSCARFNFHVIGGEHFLQLTPGFLLSEDGYRPVYGPEQGAILTGLENSVRSYNLGYLRGVLFWADQLKGDDDRIKLRADLEIALRPVSVSVPVGIRGDRTTIEGVSGEDPLHPLEEDFPQ